MNYYEMKRLSILMMVMLLGAASLMARPGYTKPVDVLQPDGTTVTLLMRGDEFLSFMTTADGYTVVKGDDGYYRYAEKQNGVLKATAVIARNLEARTTAERAFLAGRQKGVYADMTAAAKERMARAAQMYAPAYGQQADGKRRVTTIWPRINYNNFKGLVILVNWNDRQFTMSNPQAFFQKLTSEKNYQDNSLTNYPVPVTGSARDYFRDNSNGMFDPTFDVVGPVTINYSCTYPHPKNSDGSDDSSFDSRFFKVIKAVLDGVNASVNFADYDLNNDGYIDIVYFVFAGYGSYVQGNNIGYMWPHANDLTGVSTWYTGISSYDGKRFGRYACSVEIQDYEDLASQHVWLDGIGTMCHEFSHVLGLADHYDTNYETDGQASTAGAWDVMDGGADHNFGLTPVGYNVFERYQLGFAEPQELTAGTYSLESLNTSNTGYMVKSAKENEEFYVENRQNTGWDTYAPGHGLLVWRADTSVPSIWKSNKVNASPDQMCFQLLGNAPISTVDLTAVTNTMWGSKGATIDLFDIAEQDGIVTFEAGNDVYPVTVEDFEVTPLAESGATSLAGRFCTWDLYNAAIVNNTDGYGSGEHVAQLTTPSTITSSVLENGLRSLNFTVRNEGTVTSRFYIRTSTDGGTTWTVMGSVRNVAAHQSANMVYRNIPAGCRLQFVATVTGKTPATCYLDDIAVTFPKTSPSGIEAVGASRVAASNAPMYNLAGQRVANSYKGFVVKGGKKFVNK